MIIFSILKEIFTENTRQDASVFLPKKLTKHYHNEISKCFLDEVYIATEYRYIEKSLVLYKYHSHREYGIIFEDLYTELLKYVFSDIGEDGVFVPVPMHWTRYFSRGFDHIGRIVQHLSKSLELPYSPILSVRGNIFTNLHQSELSREKRLENKRNSIRISDRIEGEGVVFLFDDVISTGATANECARVLKKNGAQKVIGIFLASNIS